MIQFKRVHPLVWVFSLLLIPIPWFFMSREIGLAVAGTHEGITDVSSSTADVFGTASLFFFALMLLVTPVRTMTGWKWHEPLRKIFGLAVFASATTDAICAFTCTGDTFAGGPLTRVTGHTFLLAGAVAVALTWPLAATSTKRAQRWLGRHWKTIQRGTYVLWAVIGLHLFLLFGFRPFFTTYLQISVPMFILRLPFVSKWWKTARRKHQHLVLRWVFAIVLLGVFVQGLTALVVEELYKGTLAFLLAPPS